MRTADRNLPACTTKRRIIIADARNHVPDGPLSYRILLGEIGVGAVATAFALPFLNGIIGPDRLVSAANLAPRSLRCLSRSRNSQP
jgi:hypothetical protein